MKKGVKTYEEQEENKFKQNIKAVYEGLNYQIKARAIITSFADGAEEKHRC